MNNFKLIKLTAILFAPICLLTNCNKGDSFKEISLNDAISYVDNLNQEHKIMKYKSTEGSWDYSNSKGTGLEIANTKLGYLNYLYDYDVEGKIKCDSTGEVLVTKADITNENLTSDFIRNREERYKELVEEGTYISATLKYFVNEKDRIFLRRILTTKHYSVENNDDILEEQYDEYFHLHDNFDCYEETKIHNYQLDKDNYITNGFYTIKINSEVVEPD